MARNESTVEGPGSKTAPSGSGQPPVVSTLLAPILGRDEEIDRVVALLDAGGVRLLTLTGPGGVGKTRLAEAVWRDRREYADGAPGRAVGPAQSAGQVLPAVARACDVPDRSEASGLATALQSRHLLLYLDNFEHVLDPAPIWLAEILGAVSPPHCARYQPGPAPPQGRAPLPGRDPGDFRAGTNQEQARRRRSSWSAPRPSAPISRWIPPTGMRWRRTVAISTACPWRSSSRRPGPACCPRSKSGRGLRADSAFSPVARATPRRGSSRSRRPSPGATTSAGTRSGGSSATRPYSRRIHPRCGRGSLRSASRPDRGRVRGASPPSPTIASSRQSRCRTAPDQVPDAGDDPRVRGRAAGGAVARKLPRGMPMPPGASRWERRRRSRAHTWRLRRRSVSTGSGPSTPTGGGTQLAGASDRANAWQAGHLVARATGN